MRRLLIHLLLLLCIPATAMAEERFPPPEFRTDYKLPEVQVAAARVPIWYYLDVAALAVALGLAAYLVLKKRSRRGVFLLMVASLLYFGFYRKGCVCAVGSIQNVSLSIFGGVSLPWVVAAFFLLPIVFTLFFGRVFCSGVCPLGGIQDLVLWRPVQIPRWLEAALGLFAYFYLGLAVLLSAVGSDFVICEYDPFVSFFRLSGTAHMLLLGGVFLLVGMFIGRPYCRFFCPYGVLLRILSPFSQWQVRISPRECVDCRLCEQGCPFGAIRSPTTQRKVRLGMGDRTRLAVLIAALPVLLGLFAFLGYLASGTLARVDATVRKAELVWKDQHGQPQDVDEVKAFRTTGQTPEELYQQAAAIQKRFKVGSTFFGAWMGLVVGLKLIGWSVRRSSSEYTADAGTCVACARCFKLCPVEQDRRRQRTEEMVRA